MNWEKLFVYNYYTEFWKTPTRYLVCRKYEKFFKFFDNYKEAQDFAIKISKEDC